MSDLTCTRSFKGDGDLYGIGVRLGFYAQLLSTQLSVTFPRPGDTGSVTAAIWFYLALIITLTYKASFSSAASPLHPIEAHITLFLLYSLVPFGFQVWFRVIQEVSPFTMCSKFFIDIWHMIFTCWFLWQGMDLMFSDVALSDPNCATTETTAKVAFFFFAKVQLDGWYRTLNKVTNIIGLAYFVCKYLVSFFTSVPPKEVAMTEADIPTLSNIIDYAFDTGHLTKLLGPGNCESPLIMANDETRFPIMLRIIELAYFVRRPVFGFLQKFYMMVAVECMIAWNGIEGVNTMSGAGQIIPLILGVGGLFQAGKNVYFYFRQQISPDVTIIDHFRGLMSLDPDFPAADINDSLEQAIGMVDSTDRISVESGLSYNAVPVASKEG